MTTTYEANQTATTRPAPAEAAMIMSIMALLIIHTAAIVYAATYEPVCIPAIIEEIE